MQLIICDDNINVIKELEEKLLNKYAGGLNIHSFLTVFATMTYVQDVANGDVDIAILDINIEDGNGIELAKELQKLFPHIKIIFLTGYLQYAVDIFQAEPIYFLVKPIHDKKLFEAVERAMAMIEKTKRDVLQILLKGKICRICIEDIRYIESDKRMIHIHEKNRTVSINRQINELEQVLSKQFLRCHQSYCVNMNWIKEFTSDILLYSGERIPVSRNRCKDARSRFLQFVGEEL